MKRRITHKKIEESGWTEFLKFVIDNGFTPEDLDDHSLLGAWAGHLLMKDILSNIEQDLYGKRATSKRPPKMVGLSKQVGR